MEAMYEPGRQLRNQAQARVDNSPRWANALAVGGGVAAIVFLVAAAHESSASILVFAMLGTASGSLSIWIVGRKIAKAADNDSERLRWLGPTLGAGGLVVTIAAATIAARLDERWPIRALIGLAAAGLLATMVGILVVNQRVAGKAVQNPRFWLGASAIVFFTALLSIGTGTPPRLTTIALLIWVFALTVLKISLTPLIREDPDAGVTHKRAVRVLVVSLGFALAGMVLLIWNPLHDRLGPEPFATSFSISLVLLALSTAAIGAVNIDVSRTMTLRVWIFGLGLCATVAGVYFAFRQLPKWPVVVIFVCLLLFMIGAFFVLKGEGLALLIAAGLVLALVLVPRVGQDRTAGDGPADGAALVILGDSFTSGEGATKYLPLTNTQDPEGNWCRRSPVSYGQLIGEHYDFAVYNFSCSGAKTVDILTDGQFARPDSDIAQEVPGQFTQLEDLTEFAPPGTIDKVELVLLSIGGNDAGFSTVVKACLLPGDCGTEAAEWLATAAGISEEIEETYATITETLPNADVVVIPYPSYIGDEACGLALTTSEVRFVRELIATINAQSEAIADKFGRVYYFDEIDRAYLNHSLCSAKPGANFLNLLPRSGDLLDRFAPDSWHNGTAHPNDRGHRCTAWTLSSWLDAQPWFDRDHHTAINPGDCTIATQDEVEEFHESTPFGTARAPMIEDPLNPGDQCVAEVDDEAKPVEPMKCFDGDEWVSAQLDATANELALPFGLLILGGMLIALEFVWRLQRGLVERQQDPEAEARALDVFVPEPPSAYGS